MTDLCMFFQYWLSLKKSYNCICLPITRVEKWDKIRSGLPVVFAITSPAVA